MLPISTLLHFNEGNWQVRPQESFRTAMNALLEVSENDVALSQHFTQLASLKQYVSSRQSAELADLIFARLESLLTQAQRLFNSAQKSISSSAKAHAMEEVKLAVTHVKELVERSSDTEL